MNEFLSRDEQVKAAYKQGFELQSRKRYAEALKFYEQALKLNPSYAPAHVERGITLSEMGRSQEALAAYDEALRLDPRNDRALNNKGIEMLALKNYREALAHFELALQINPRSSYFHNNRGSALLNLNRYQEALIAFDKATQIDPRYEYSWINKCKVLLPLKRYDELIAACDRVLQINPNTPYAAFIYNSKGMALTQMGRYEEALNAYEQVSRLDPNDTSIPGKKEDLRRKLKERPAPEKKAAPVTSNNQSSYKIAQLFDGFDREKNEPYFSAERARISDPAERERVANYLLDGVVFLMDRSLDQDILDPARPRKVGGSWRTDGVWIWNDAHMYYVKNHGIIAGADFYKHIVAQRYRLAEPNDEQVRRIYQWFGERTI